MSLDSSNHLGQTVGAKLREARLAKKYTQNQLAQPDFSVSYISAIERGQIQPSLRALEIFAQRLGINSTYLLSQQSQAASKGQEEAIHAVQTHEDLAWLLVEAQLALHQGQPMQAVELLHPLFLRKGETSQQIAICYVLGWAYLAVGYVQESEAILAEAASLAQAAAGSLYPRILSMQGAVYAAMHRMEQAIHFQQASLTALKQWPMLAHDVFFHAQIYTRLGQAYSQLGEPVRSLEMFQQAVALLQSPPLQIAHNDLLAYYQEQTDLVWARLFYAKCWQAHVQSQRPALKSQIQHALGRVLLLSQPDEAYTYLQALAQDASARQDLLVLASAKVHLADWFLTHADFKQAEFALHEALTQTHALGESMIRADALILQGRLAYMQQTYEQGDVSFMAGLAMFEHLQFFEELIEHLTLYARLLEERGLLHKAIIYWKQAYTYQRKKTSMLE